MIRIKNTKNLPTTSKSFVQIWHARYDGVRCDRGVYYKSQHLKKNTPENCLRVAYFFSSNVKLCLKVPGKIKFTTTLLQKKMHSFFTSK